MPFLKNNDIYMYISYRALLLLLFYHLCIYRLDYCVIEYNGDFK